MHAYLDHILNSNRDHPHIIHVIHSYQHAAVHNILLIVTLEIVLLCTSTGESSSLQFS